ncbi:cytochrome C biogenesis protein [Knoellia sinensis KCTC 19936]|uniref:Cytochrome C biogenesis protein n=1 Tax=Knoellia sinensis KCTC 19936 TaxID=1385520 RepID=A0A0A0IZ38_9MICO|nr:cytochrome c biogenesis protein CcdA [Knoellia sinensis]KGN29754.1 cytochrome C biogenesis protein [Knoellia sinensis KCTC 19936]
MTDTIASGSLSLAVLVAALAGLVSFASPCVLPLVPGFLGYVTGLSDTALQQRSRGRLVAGAILFVLGFALVFVLGSIFIATLGRSLVEHRTVLMRVGGALIIVMGLVFLGVGAGAGSQRQFTPSWRPQTGLLGAPVVGAIFGLGWAPCTGPTLAAVMTLSASTTNPSTGRAVTLATAYALGLGLPFILAAAGIERFGRVSGWVRDRHRLIQVLGGGMLILVGLLLLTGVWEDLTRWLQAELVSGFTVPL